MKRLENKVSIITGAAQGIGLATALKFAEEGATVIVCELQRRGQADALGGAGDDGNLVLQSHSFRNSSTKGRWSSKSDSAWSLPGSRRMWAPG